METSSATEKKGFISQLKSNAEELWLNLSDSQKEILKKVWLILTYKWQWQIILNAPFLFIWILDQTVPAVHSFDMHLISLLPIPIKIKTLLGFS